MYFRIRRVSLLWTFSSYANVLFRCLHIHKNIDQKEESPIRLAEFRNIPVFVMSWEGISRYHL
jgi:hypothetical protein